MAEHMFKEKTRKNDLMLNCRQCSLSDKRRFDIFSPDHHLFALAGLSNIAQMLGCLRAKLLVQGQLVAAV